MSADRWCRIFAHRIGFIDTPGRPLDIVRECTRCHDPSTRVVLVQADDDPNRLGYVRVQGFDRLAGWLEAKRES